MGDTDLLELKLILLGESGVGKTSIIGRYVNDEFKSNVAVSTTMSYVGKTIVRNNQSIKLNIWDTIGQEKFRAISRLFLSDTKIVVLVYSINSKDSFNNLDYWLKLYKDILDTDTVLGVVANKIDLFLEQEVPDEMGKEYAEKNGAIFGLISAKDNKIGIDKYIEKLVDAYLSKGENIIKMGSNKTIKLELSNEENNKKFKSCCSPGNNKIKQKKYSSILSENKGVLYSVFLGDKGVGKTSIIKRIEGNKVNPDQEHTDRIYKFLMNYNKNDMDLKLKIYDVDVDKMKSTEFINTVQSCKIFFVVFNIKERQTLTNVDYWIEVIKKCKDDEKEENYLIYILGNQNDGVLEDSSKKREKEQIIEEAKKYCCNKNRCFKAISALENKEISGLIDDAIDKYLYLQ